MNDQERIAQFDAFEPADDTFANVPLEDRAPTKPAKDEHLVHRIDPRVARLTHEEYDLYLKLPDTKRGQFLLNPQLALVSYRAIVAKKALTSVDAATADRTLRESATSSAEVPQSNKC